MTEPRDRHPVLILGAGINGSCIARELVLNGVPVYLVDKGDICSGTTSRSSQLIHDGLRIIQATGGEVAHGTKSVRSFRPSLSAWKIQSYNCSYPRCEVAFFVNRHAKLSDQCSRIL